ncbi:MAG: MFS transporter [Burkholderiales bacterium]
MSGLAPRRERWLLVTLAGVQFAVVLDFMMLMPLGESLMRLFAIAPTRFGLLVSVYMIAAAAAGFAASFIVDRFDRRSTLVAACACFTATTVLTATAQDYLWLLAARAIAGAFGGILFATVLAIVGDAIPEGRRGRALGVVMSASSIASIVGIPLSLWLAARYSWRAPFFANTALAAAILAAALRTVPHIRGHLEAARGRAALGRVAAVFGNANHLRAFGLSMTLNFSGFLIVPFIAPYLVANVGVTEAELPVTYFFGGLAALFFVRQVGRLTDLHGRRRVFGWVAAASIVGILVVTHLPPVPLWGVVLAQMLLMATFPGRFVPAMAILQSAVAAELRGSFMSFNAALQQLAAGAGSFVAAAMVARGAGGELTGFDAVGWVSMLATGLAIALAGRVRRAPAPRAQARR